jgi:hypothetical protein
MLAGNEVLCAGTISIKDGVLKGVSNLSGHYAPDTAALTTMLREWQNADAVPLDRVVVLDKALGITTFGKKFMAGDYKDLTDDRLMGWARGARI